MGHILTSQWDTHTLYTTETSAKEICIIGQSIQTANMGQSENTIVLYFANECTHNCSIADTSEWTPRGSCILDDILAAHSSGQFRSIRTMNQQVSKNERESQNGLSKQGFRYFEFNVEQLVSKIKCFKPVCLSCSENIISNSGVRHTALNQQYIQQF